MSQPAEASLAYLSSPAALASLARDAYWPKWDSPWWHMLLLHELGLSARIPAAPVRAVVESLREAYPHFPLREEDLPPGVSMADTGCHCSLGNIAQVLFACGVDLDRELPWIRAWFLRYQMADGGFNCDNSAYLEKTECPSSMVGTIAPFEAMLRCTPRPFRDEERAFLDRAAQFLIGRQLRLGSPTRHNAEEREAEPRWLQLAFPRFYFYDVLRGLTALQEWSRRTGGVIPPESVASVVAHLRQQFPDGQARCQRLSYAGVGTRQWSPEGWTRVPRASTFALLDSVSSLGSVSPVLTEQLAAALAASPAPTPERPAT